MLRLSPVHRGLTKDMNGGFRSHVLQTIFNSSFDMHGYRLLVVFWEVQMHILLRLYIVYLVVLDMLE
jgi:hypothetical protein